MDPPADDSLGYCRLVGALVVTQAGQELGRVRWGRVQGWGWVEEFVLFARNGCRVGC
jgi:hypothetical protein